jgi:hypothetical protein
MSDDWNVNAPGIPSPPGFQNVLAEMGWLEVPSNPMVAQCRHSVSQPGIAEWRFFRRVRTTIGGSEFRGVSDPRPQCLEQASLHPATLFQPTAFVSFRMP